jgi:hypothetical protein
MALALDLERVPAPDRHPGGALRAGRPRPCARQHDPTNRYPPIGIEEDRNFIFGI